MSANSIPKLAISAHWVSQTLIPYLRYAFSHNLPHNTDLTPLVRSAIAFSLTKPDYPSDGDDLLFERIFLSIDHRYKNLAPDLSVVTDYPEPLAKFLIRRAQLKGPYELLGRNCPPSEAWLEQDGKRLENPNALKDMANPPITPKRSKSKRSKAALPPPKVFSTSDIDPRLWNAQPGQWISPEVPDSMTFPEDQYYRTQNQRLEAYWTQTQAAERQQRQQNAAISVHPGQIPYNTPGRGLSAGQSATYGPHMMQQAPMHLQNLGQKRIPVQTLPSYVTFARDSTPQTSFPQEMLYQPMQQDFIPTTSGYAPPQPLQQNNTFVFESYHQQHPHPVPIQPRSAVPVSGYSLPRSAPVPTASDPPPTQPRRGERHKYTREQTDLIHRMQCRLGTRDPFYKLAHSEKARVLYELLIATGPTVLHENSPSPVLEPTDLKEISEHYGYSEYSAAPSVTGQTFYAFPHYLGHKSIVGAYPFIQLNEIRKMDAEAQGV